MAPISLAGDNSSTDIESAIVTGRQEALGAVTVTLSWLSAVAFTFEFVDRHSPYRWALFGGLFLAAVALNRASFLSLRARSGLLLVTLYAGSLFAFIGSGLSGPGILYLISLPILATIFFGRTGGIVAAAGAGITWLAMGLAYRWLHLAAPSPLASNVFADWVYGTLNLVVVAGPLIAPLEQFLAAEAFVVITSYEKQQAVEARMALEKKSRELEQVSRKLTDTNNQLQEQSASLAEANRRLQEDQERLLASEKMASLGRLTAGMAHELNTPLAAVRAGLAEARQLVDEYQAALADPQITVDDHRAIGSELLAALKLANAAAERAAGFVRSIKASTRDLEASESQLFDAMPVIEDAVQLLGHALRQGRCRVIVHPVADRVVLSGSPGRLAQVITNLVTNAIDASQPTGGAIDIYLAPADGGVEMRVCDQGCGIPPELMTKIFDPMFTTKPFGQGTGLGLTIVHDLVTSSFGGTTEFDSRVGHGATCIVRFPAAAAANRADDGRLN